VLVEEFSDTRVRPKREVAARRRDEALGFDAYRTTAGLSEGRFSVVTASAAIAAGIGGIALLTRSF
jgi:hypothetical protein